MALPVVPPVAAKGMVPLVWREGIADLERSYGLEVLPKGKGNYYQSAVAVSAGLCRRTPK